MSPQQTTTTNIWSIIHIYLNKHLLLTTFLNLMNSETKTIDYIQIRLRSATETSTDTYTYTYI